MLLRRLTLPKYLFRQAQRTLDRPERPHSWGLSASLLQDAVEALLRLVAEHRRVPDVSDRTRFVNLLDAIERELPEVGGHRAALTTLNTTRVAFKHRGHEVAEDDARAFLFNVEAFLAQACRAAFDIDLASVSLAGAIGHRRTQAWLAKAERAFADEMYADSVAHASGALAICMAHIDTAEPSIQLRPMFTYEGVEGFREQVGHSIRTLHARVDLLSRGVDMAEFDHFASLTPLTTVNRHGGVRQHARPGAANRSRQDARFCIDFAVDSALALRASRPPMREVRTRPEQERVRVTRACEILVDPGSESQEVVRVAAPGEELAVSPWRYSQRAGHVAVLDDGDIAYLRQDCVAQTMP